jgi:hypothetical protein
LPALMAMMKLSSAFAQKSSKHNHGQSDVHRLRGKCRFLLRHMKNVVQI